jgi:hypothetical protein
MILKASPAVSSIVVRLSQQPGGNYSQIVILGKVHKMLLQVLNRHLVSLIKMSGRSNEQQPSTILCQPLAQQSSCAAISSSS